VTETLQKIIRGPAAPVKPATALVKQAAAAPTAEQVKAGFEALSGDDRSMATMKAVLKLGPSDSLLNKVTGGLSVARPIAATQLAPGQMAPVKNITLTKETVEAYLANLDQETRFKLFLNATLSAGGTKRF
jgi:hypothetical protein